MLDIWGDKAYNSLNKRKKEVMKMFIVPKRYEGFYKAVCEWNKSKNWQNFRRLLAVCGEPCAPNWQKPWFILKNTLNGNYKYIEKNFKLSIDTQDKI